MSAEPRKRSRFDQSEPDPPRKSRFDRRSRSPPKGGDGDATRRSRSPVASTEGNARRDAAAAAAEAAARINASLQGKKGVQHVDVPPVRSAQSPSAGPSVKSPSAGGLNDEIYQQDGDYIKDIEVNDLRNRYTLTKGSTQKMIKEETGADVTTRGEYYPDKSMATAAAPPLFLHVTSQTKEGLEKAVKRIEELKQQELPNLIDERRFRRPREDAPVVERDHLGRRKWPEERIPIDLEPIPGFNLRAQVVGAGGSYVKHIQQETRCRVQIKGRGSGFKEFDTGNESDEQMYLHVAGPDAAEVENAKQMCISLLESVKESYAAFKERGPRGSGGPGGFGGPQDNPNYTPRDRNNGSYGGGSSYGGGGSAYGGQGAYAQQAPQGYETAGSPQQAAQQPGAANMTPDQVAAWTVYYSQNPSLDPYQEYGGFAAVMAAYAQPAPPTPATPMGYGGGYYPGQDGTPVQQNGAGAPPPPPTEDVPPPPPPPSGPPGAGGYSSVPPPPGM
nr:hypothetical protein B0A51_14214 [Rachicladosporium sp. CCFEE 5018]